MTSTRSRKRAASEAASVTRNLMLAPMVVAMRMPILAVEAANSAVSGRSEGASAVGEKWSALADGMAAAQFAWMRGALMLPLAMAKAASPVQAMVDMANDVTTAALKPAGLQVQRNHRRLTRRG